MSDITNINARKPPVIYTVTIVHHWDDTLEVRIEDVADDERSREAVMSAFRRISGAEAELDAAIARAEIAEAELATYNTDGPTLHAAYRATREERDALRALLIEARPFVQDSVGFTHHELRARIAAATGEKE